MSETRQTTINLTVPTKSAVAALLLTFFFGPFGMFYSTVTGGIIMLIITVPVAVLTLGLGCIITQPICIIWAVVAVNSHNKAVVEKFSKS